MSRSATTWGVTLRDMNEVPPSAARPPSTLGAVPRLLAAVVAVLMVVGAIAVRARLDEGGGGGGPELRLVCSTELSQACEELADRSRARLRVTVEPAGVTANRLASAQAGEVGLDGWLVAGPWPDIVEGARQRAGLEPVLRTGPVAARSPVVLTAWPDRAALLRQRCPQGQVTWRCLGDVAGQPWGALGGPAVWGQVKPGHAHPGEQALGLTTVAAATVSFLGRSDLARVDVEENDAYRAWLTRLERSVPTFRPSAGTPLADMVLKGPAAFDVVGTVEAEAGPLLATTARPDKPQVIYPSPVTTADVVLGTVPREPGRRLTEVLGSGAARAALAEAGWRVPDERRAAGVLTTPPLPPQSGLPDPGVLDTLRQLAAPEATR